MSPHHDLCIAMTIVNGHIVWSSVHHRLAFVRLERLYRRVVAATVLSSNTATVTIRVYWYEQGHIIDAEYNIAHIVSPSHFP